MQVVLFIFYLLLCCYLIIIIPFFKNSPVSTGKIISLFLIKILAGVAYAFFYTLPAYSKGADTWRFYRLSIKETEWLKKEPLAFLKDIFVHGYNTSGNLFTGENSYWNDLKSNILVKLIALMNVVTLKSYYTNIILFNFLFLFGLIALLKLLIPLHPDRKTILIGAIFILPSTLFWCSGIHKDGLILSASGLVIYYFYKGLRTSFSPKKIILISLCLLLIFFLRNYVALALLPALLCWWYSEKKPTKSWMVFSAIYSIGIIAFFVLPKIFSFLNFPLFLSQKQNEFLQLNGTSSVTSTSLQPSVSSFLSYLPTALDIAFLRPYLTETKNLSYIPATIEIYLLLALFIFSIIFLNRKQLSSPVVLFLLFFSLSIMIISGYTVTFSGAIVRYRSFVLPLLITPLLCSIDFGFMRNKFNLPLKKSKLSG